MSQEPEETRMSRRGARSAEDTLAIVATRALELEEIALALASSGDVADMAQAFLPIVAGAARAQDSCLYVPEPSGRYDPVGFSGVAEDIRGLVEESLVEQAVLSLVAQSGGSCTRDSLVGDEAFVEWCDEQAIPAAARHPHFELYMPLRARDDLAAVLALGPRSSGTPYDESDFAFLQHIASSTAVAVRRCVLEAENARKLEVLQALARFTSEITSTLDLNRVLVTIVNTTEAVIERDRAVVALVESGHLRIRAVSDKAAIEVNEAEVLGLVEILAALEARRTRIRVTAGLLEAGEVDGGARAIFEPYFEAGELQSLLALPLQDEEGLLGFLILESRNPDGFADPTAEESLGILARSVSIAIRNADLYRRVPMVGVLGPLAYQRRRLASMTPARRRALGIAAGTLFILFGVIPWPRYVAGPAEIRPSEVLPVPALVDGVVARVHVRGGERVAAGAPVATLRNPEADAAYGEARAELAIAERRSAEATERRDPGEARRWSLEARSLEAKLTQARAAAQDHRLVAPVAGLVLTSRVEERVGAWLEAGDVLCEVARLDPIHAEVLIPEEELRSITPGDRARVKVPAHPEKIFDGRILTIAPRGEVNPGGESRFAVTVECENRDLALLAGMTGRAKLDAGYGPWLWNVLRPFVRALRLSLWI